MITFFAPSRETAGTGPRSLPCRQHGPSRGSWIPRDEDLATYGLALDEPLGSPTPDHRGCGRAVSQINRKSSCHI